FPEKAQIDIDTREKFMVCMGVTAGNDDDSEGEKAARQNANYRHVDLECPQSAGPEPKQERSYRLAGDMSSGSGGGLGEAPKLGNGTFAYCTRCAEMRTRLNKIREQGARGFEGAAKEHEWSVVERAGDGVGKAGGDDELVGLWEKEFKDNY